MFDIVRWYLFFCKHSGGFFDMLYYGQSSAYEMQSFVAVAFCNIRWYFCRNMPCFTKQDIRNPYIIACACNYAVHSLWKNRPQNVYKIICRNAGMQFCGWRYIFCVRKLFAVSHTSANCFCNLLLRLFLLLLLFWYFLL